MGRLLRSGGGRRGHGGHFFSSFVYRECAILQCLISRQETADSPRGLVDGAETLLFLGVLALGLRNSRFERFWPLAILIISVGEWDCSKAGADAGPQGSLLNQGSAQTSLCAHVTIQVFLTMSLHAEGIGLELACHCEKGSRAHFGSGFLCQSTTARRLVAELIYSLVTRESHHARGQLAFLDARMSAA